MKAVTRTTAKMIADTLGLSIATVDRALNNRGNVKKETYQRIMETVNELNYKPNKLASALSRKMKYKMAVLYPSSAQYFWDQVEVGLAKAMDELKDYGVEFSTFRFNSKNETARDLLSRIIQSSEYHAIAIAAGEDPLDDVINDGIQKGIQICTFNQDIPNSQRVFYVGADYLKAGRLAAELTCKFVGKSGKIAIVGNNQDFQTITKNAGFIESAKAYPKIEIVGPYTLQDFIKIVKGKNVSELAGIYVSTSDIFEVANTLEDDKNNLTIVCHDLNDEIYHHLMENHITATITQEPVNQGYLALTQLFHHLAFGEEGIQEQQLIKLEVVMKENAMDYL
ncbi:LacI family DNA-binding transcriptional regulator [Alkalicoccobacillus porphyridii]|uniref:Substrate-binding domain-containing protein n=1 Tax=Alkalicoccobacillus porphyridii TaxID=2597270 RepID=A0A554A1P9_9BACI|nr:LacI family DNA-binding transcriptional regulator [Alkalicoccobacillus porphyridii]TSB47612.1 substrate-binding domain-containing protein [Alkalicoccobacillus porphyridii]